MTKRRTYLVTFDGRQRMVDAVDARRAERHMLDVELAKLRKLFGEETRTVRAIELSEFVRAGGTVEQEGVMPAETPELSLEEVRKQQARELDLEGRLEAQSRELPAEKAEKGGAE